MPRLSPKRHAERAADALKRGEPVHVGRTEVQAPEPSKNADWLVISAYRAAHLGIKAPQGTPVATPWPRSTKAREALLWGTSPLPGLHARPATAEEIAALQLAGAAGMLPMLAVRAPEAAEALRVSVQAIRALQKTPITLSQLPTAALPLAAAKDARVIPFMEAGGLTHLAILVGAPERHKNPLVRVHSSCLTGDVLGSLRCDCGDQLQQALRIMSAEKGGVVIYLNQEGRGIGLAHKLRAYALQDAGHDTVDANTLLGFAPDARDFSVAATMLKALGMNSIRLLTNNPLKPATLKKLGVTVAATVPIKPAVHEKNARYLSTKATRMGHQF